MCEKISDCFKVGEIIEVEDRYGTWNECVVTIIGADGKPAYGRIRRTNKYKESNNTK